MTTVEATNKYRKRLWRFSIVGGLMGIGFVLGVAVTAFLALRLQLPLALIMASTGTQATTNSLYSGNSATRMTVLIQLKRNFDTQPSMTFDEQTVAWILPAIEQCKTDSDPQVIALAEELVSDIKIKTTLPPK